MPEVSQEIKTAINTSIMRVKQKFINSPHIFLTEEDLRCNLYSELLKENVLSRVERTQDNSNSIPVHSEVRWYGENKKMKKRSDLVILDVSKLITIDNGFTQLPSKGYGFSGSMAVIETKLRRVNGPSDNAWKKDLLKDINKIRELQTLVDLEALYYLIIFDKKRDIGADIPNTDDPKIEIHYLTIQSNNQRHIIDR